MIEPASTPDPAAADRPAAAGRPGEHTDPAGPPGQGQSWLSDDDVLAHSVMSSASPRRAS